MIQTIAVQRFLLGCTLLLVALRPGHALAADGPWKLSSYQSCPRVTWLNKTQPIRSLTFKSEPYLGHATDVFAFYATPGTLTGKPDRPRSLPGVVLLHGGGGTAFAEWVELWARRGYAAIAVDLVGNRPPAPRFDAKTGRLISDGGFAKGQRTRLPLGGPSEGPQSKFVSVGDDWTDDWQLHAVAAAMRAHSLLRSFPETDADRTAVTGISWGGYLTCLVAALDPRFKAAVPVYGCGHLYDGESVQRPAIDRLPAEKRALWIATYDPSAWMAKCRTPILFVNGTNDVHYPLTSYAQTYSLVKGPCQLRIKVGMRHGHRPGWTPPEIGIFVDHYLLGKPGLPQLARPELEGREARVAYSASVPLARAHIHFTTEKKKLSERRWQSRPATVADDLLRAEVPPHATIWFLTATDRRQAMVSTEVMFDHDGVK